MTEREAVAKAIFNAGENTWPDPEGPTPWDCAGPSDRYCAEVLAAAAIEAHKAHLSASAPKEMTEGLTWALCAHIRAKKCRKCPAKVETPYGPGAQMCRAAADDSVAVVLSTISASGYVIVPREPTEEMIEAGHEVIARVYVAGDECPSAEDAYRAMIATCNDYLQVRVEARASALSPNKGE